MFLPYNVDRPARRTPHVTHALMGLNIFIYLVCVVHANLVLSGEKEAYRRDNSTETNSSQDGNSSEESGGATNSSDGSANDSSIPPESSFKPDEPGLPRLAQRNQGDFIFVQQNGEMPPAPAEADAGAGENQEDEAIPARAPSDEEYALEFPFDPKEPLASEREKGRARWLRDNINAPFVLNTAPAALELFAYHAAAPTAWSFITAMFLHEGLLLLLPNLLFLWVFGRATEDTLGHGLFAATYFVCGMAATLLYHVMATNFAPTTVGVHFTSASGAIAGVLGLFAPRFYRTPVRMIYTTGMGGRILYTGSGILAFLFGRFWGLGNSGYALAFVIILPIVIVMGEDDWWKEKKLIAAWMIGAWLLKELAPALIQIATHKHAGMGHWANIGGFLCGAAYALMIGSHKEGKAEYFVDEARSSIDKKYSTSAIETAQKLLAMRPNDPVGYQLLAEAYDHKNDAEKALDNYEIAIDKYLAQNDRMQASALYLSALLKHAGFILPPAKQVVLAGEMAKNGDWKNAAESMVKVPYTFPDAPESEVCLLRSAQMYAERLEQPQMALQLLNDFQARYPDSQWAAQQNRLRLMVEGQMNGKAAETASVTQSAKSNQKK